MTVYKVIRLVFVLGVITIIFFLGKSIFDDIKKDPIYSQDTAIKTGYLTDNKIVEFDDGKIHELSYQYVIHHQIHKDKFQSN